MFTIRSPTALLRQHDFHAILAVVLIDLGLTINGISTGQGSEANPFYQPFTESVDLMLAGLGLYIGILAVLSLTLSGTTRYVLASVAFGMHVAGTMTWLHTVIPAARHLNVFYYTLAATSTTVLFYIMETRHTSASDDTG